MLRALVIGTSGQLARELHRGAPTPQVQLIAPEKVNLADPRATLALLERTSPDVILNAAAYTGVDRAESEREAAFAVNEVGPRVLANWCGAQKRPLLHVSTDYVFDGRKTSAYLEEDDVAPLGVYGESKLAGERAIRAEAEQYVILRTSWVFSAHGQNFVKTMVRLAREREELRVVADQLGRPTPAAELAQALLSLVDRYTLNGTLPWGTYHFAGAGSTSWHGFAEAIVMEQAQFTGKTPRVVAISTSEYPTPARRPPNSVLDTTRIELTLGLSPPPWQTGLRDVVRELFGDKLP